MRQLSRGEEKNIDLVQDGMSTSRRSRASVTNVKLHAQTPGSEGKPDPDTNGLGRSSLSLIRDMCPCDCQLMVLLGISLIINGFPNCITRCIAIDFSAWYLDDIMQIDR